MIPSQYPPCPIFILGNWYPPHALISTLCFLAVKHKLCNIYPSPPPRMTDLYEMYRKQNIYMSPLNRKELLNIHSVTVKVRVNKKRIAHVIIVISLSLKKPILLTSWLKTKYYHEANMSIAATWFRHFHLEYIDSHISKIAWYKSWLEWHWGDSFQVIDQSISGLGTHKPMQD